MRGKAHFRLAGLYFKKEDWAKSREHYTAKEIQELNVRERQTAAEQAAECLVNQKEYLKAADEYKALFKNPDYEQKQPEYLVRLGEVTLMAERYPDAFIILRKVNSDYPKTQYAARSYYNMGDYEQQKTLNYEQAVVYYDSSYSSLNYCDWAQKSRTLSEALKRLIAMRNMNDSLKKDSVPNLDNFFGTEFQIAELFLFKLDQVDSAVNRLTGIIENSNDSARVMLATYARAFIYDEYKGDEDTAEELYKEIIEKYPGTEYAKQAQANLGMRVTIKTRDDEAKERYLQAESLWTVASEVPLDQMEQVDSAYATAFAAFDSLYRDYPDTESGVQALYMKFVYFQMDPERGDSVGVVLNELRSKHRDTPWGKYAAKVLDHRLAITDSEIERLRRRVQQSIEHIDQMSAQYHESINKKPKEKKAEVKSKEDEILENTYNSMYDFE